LRDNVMNRGAPSCGNESLSRLEKEQKTLMSGAENGIELKKQTRTTIVIGVI